MADYTDLSTRFTYKRLLQSLDLNGLVQNDIFLKDNGWAEGTAFLFYQVVAPTGWTRAAGSAIDGSLARVVSADSLSSGGSHDVKSSITLAHVHDIIEEAAHTHSATHTQGSVLSSVSNYKRYGQYGFSVQSGTLQYQSGGGGSVSPQFNETASNSGLQTQAAGAHDHGGETGGELTDISLSYSNMLVCIKDAATSSFTDNTTAFYFLSELKTSDFLSLANNDEYLHDQLTPENSICLFSSIISPTGWVKQTTIDDSCVRLVTGDTDSGGSSGGSSGLSEGITLAHTHSMISEEAHLHELANHVMTANTGPSTLQASGGWGLIPDGGTGLLQLGYYNPAGGTRDCVKSTTKSDGVSNVSTESEHTHEVQAMLTDISLAYVDTILASKTYTEETYQDATGFFSAANGLLPWQHLAALANNDKFVHYHTIPTGATSFFYQPLAPYTWTKKVITGLAIRIVSGSSGGSSSAGSDIASSITLAHNHTLSSVTHIHTIAEHEHEMDTVGVSQSGLSGEYLSVLNSKHYDARYVVGSETNLLLTNKYKSMVSGATTGNNSHAHGGQTSEELADIQLKYADIICCVKN